MFTFSMFYSLILVVEVETAGGGKAEFKHEELTLFT